ncbi:MAG: tyrosine-type recombinase/integrase [Gammaproteobacteria bacterium]
MKTQATMQTRVNDYLDERRRLGFALIKTGRTLASFARYVDQRGYHGALTLELMADWAKHDKWQKKDSATWARRLKALRPFTRYLQQFEPLTEIPDESIFGAVPGRVSPHIYREQEIVDLLAAAHALGPRGDLRAATYETLFGLIASAGLRVSEAVHLLDSDVDLKLGILVIRQTKFAKSRQLPLHSSTVEALLSYRQLRNHHIVVTPETTFFVATRGNLLGQGLGLRSVNRVFESLRIQLDWRNRGAHNKPRIHDLRHTFAVRRVMLWHEQGTDIDQAMLALSTYMGHAKISNTYWYLTAVPELMAVAAGKFERFVQAQEVQHA